MSVLLSLMRHTQHMDSVGEKCIVLNKKYTFTVFFKGSMIYNKWEFIHSENILVYVGVLKVPIQFLRLSALPESRSLVCSESAQYHRPHIFQETVNTYEYVWFILTPIFGVFNSGRRNVCSLNSGQCHILHGKLFNGCCRMNVCYADDNAQLVAS